MLQVSSISVTDPAGSYKVVSSLFRAMELATDKTQNSLTLQADALYVANQYLSILYGTNQVKIGIVYACRSQLALYVSSVETA